MSFLTLNYYFDYIFFSLDLKKSYVDILGNSGQTVPATSKDVAPPQMDMQFFNPQVQQPQVKYSIRLLKI